MMLALAVVAVAALAQEGTPMSSIYDFTLKDIDGRDRSLAEFKGQVLLVVNVASKCGFTRQYAGLEKLTKPQGPRDRRARISPQRLHGP